jgi:hypothetical protein
VVRRGLACLVLGSETKFLASAGTTFQFIVLPVRNVSAASFMALVGGAS